MGPEPEGGLNDLATNPLHIEASVPFEFELIPAPADLADLVNTFFSIEADAGIIEEMMPAYSAQIVVYVQGGGTLTSEDGHTYRSETLTCLAPLMQATPFTIEGPAKLIGASLTSIGWQCLSGLPADEVNNRTVPASQVFDIATTGEVLRIVADYDGGQFDAGPLLQVIGDALRDCRSNLKPRQARFVDAVMRWLSSDLNPELEALYEQIAVSERTAQRLCRQYFGVSPSRLLKRYRAIRAAMLLANPQLPQEMRDEILSAYFDQAHLIHDIRRFTGRTPRALKDESFVQDTLDPQGHGESAKILR